MDELEDSVHLQQLKKIAAVLKEAQQQNDSVTWVPDTIPQYVQDAVKKALDATNTASPHLPSSPAPPCLPGSPQTSLPTAAPTGYDLLNFDHGEPHAVGLIGSQAALEFGTHSDAAGVADQHGSAADMTEAEAGVVIIGSQYIRAQATTKSSSTSWVVTICLVPDGLPNAAAADAGGGLACLEVVCRVLNLQDCVPAAATPGITKALSKVKWREFGLSYKDFAPSTTDTTGILTLDVMPHAFVTPLAMVVCSSNNLCACLDPTLASAPTTSNASIEAAAQDSVETTTTAQEAAALSSRKRKSNSDKKPPTLSCNRETALYTAAFEDALLALKARLPAGYLQGKLEACLASCLPPISVSLTTILMHAANPVLCQQACELLSCDAQQLQQTLLLKLQTAASEAVAVKSSVGSSARQLESQRRQRVAVANRRNKTTAAAATAAAMAAAAGDGMGENGSIEADGNAGQQQEPGQSQSWQQPRQQAGSQASATLRDVSHSSLQQQQQAQLLQVQDSNGQASDGEQQPDWLCIEQPALPTSAAMTAGQLAWLDDTCVNSNSIATGTQLSQGVDPCQSVAADDDSWHGRPRRQQPDNMLPLLALQQQQKPRSTGCTADGIVVHRSAWQHSEAVLGTGAPGSEAQNSSRHCGALAHANMTLEQPSTGAACELFGSFFPYQSLLVFASGAAALQSLK